MLTSPTKTMAQRSSPSAQAGFTLLELMAALFVASVLAMVAMPSLQRLNESMRYREAVRDLVTAAKTARRDAFAAGESYDLLILSEEPAWALVPAHRSVEVVRGALPTEPLPEELRFDVVSAAEVSPGSDISSIRFFPQGGSSGGDIDVLRTSGSGVRIKIDWLLGEVTQVVVSE